MGLPPVHIYFVILCLQLYLVSSAETNAKSETGKHLTIGSTDPPLIPGSIRFYSMRFCPFCHRVTLVLLAKNITYDPVFINIKEKPEWYTDKIPSGKVPALLVDGQSVYESLIIADFLDEKFPQRPLHSKDPLQKAKDRILIEAFGKVTSAFNKVMKVANSSMEEEFNNVLKELEPFDKELASRGSHFFGGEKPGMVDYMIWPWFERIEMFKVLYGDKFVIPEQKLPNLSKWVEEMKSDDAVKQYYLTPEQHAKFIKTILAGKYDFDVLTHE